MPLPDPTLPANADLGAQAAAEAATRRVWRRWAGAAQAPWLHREVSRRMAERLQLIRQPAANWIDWSGFAGAGADEVAAVWPQARRWVAEPVPELADRSRQALKPAWWAWRQRQVQARSVGLQSEAPQGQASMLWANMLWHTVPDPRALLAQWHGALASDGFVMFSTLGPDTLKTLRQMYAAKGWPAPCAPFMDMHDIGDMLVHAGFADPVMDQETLQLTWSSPQAALAELHGLGGNLFAKRFQGLRTPRWRARLETAMAEQCLVDGRITLGFELVYGHAYKGQARSAQGETTVVSLESLRASLRKS